MELRDNQAKKTADMKLKDARLLLGRKTMTNLDSILKSRDINLPTKVHLVKSMIFEVLMYGCESWTIKKTEHQRTDNFKLWCCRRLLRVPWTTRRSNQSILKEISAEYSLQGLMLRLKLQSFGHLMWRDNSFERTLMLGKIEGGSRREWQRMRWLDGITDSMTWVWVSSGCWWWTREAWHAAVHGVTKSWTRLSNWTTEKQGWFFSVLHEVESQWLQGSSLAPRGCGVGSIGGSDCSPQGSSVPGLFQARILEWVAMSSSRGSSWPRDGTWVSCLAGGFFTDRAAREALLKY